MPHEHLAQALSSKLLFPNHLHNSPGAKYSCSAPQMLDIANKQMEAQEISVKNVYSLYRQGVNVDSISNYYSLQPHKVKKLIAKGEANRIYAEELVAKASRSQLRFIGSVMSKKSLSSQEKISKYCLQPKAFRAWEYAWENGLLEVAVASLATEMPMKYREINCKPRENPSNAVLHGRKSHVPIRPPKMHIRQNQGT